MSTLNDSDKARLDWCIQSLQAMKEPMRQALHDHYTELLAVIRTLKTVNQSE